VKRATKRVEVLAIAAVAALLWCLSARADGDPGRGRARAQMCEGCHGIAEYRTAYPVAYPVPKIDGQQAAYIVKALQSYKAGARKHPTMRSVAATLSDQDMDDLAAYYAARGKRVDP
jgi:cytochrome c553